MKGFVVALLAKCMQIIAAIFRLFPLKKRVVLMSRQSSEPSESYLILRDELLKNLSSKQVVMCLCKPETKSSKGAFILGTLKQLFYASTSRFIIVDGYVPAVSIPKKPRKTAVMQTWHSMGAIKKFGYQCLDTPAGRTSAAAKTAHMHGNYDIVAASGPGVISVYAQAFNYPKTAVAPLGMLRMDYLLNEDASKIRKENFAKACEAHPYLCGEKNVIIYAPTLRKGEGYENWIEDNLHALASACTQDCTLVYCGHPLENDAAASLEEEFSCLHIVHDFATIDVLEAAHTVITDYSAIAFDAAMLNKNTIFYVPDIDKYKKSPGLNIDLGDSSICFASKDAHKIMEVAAQNEHEGFKAWLDFCNKYFEGITPNVAQRYCEIIIKHLQQ